MSESFVDSGRSNQKWRTHKALVEAAGELIAAGEHPSIASAADRARVSPATAYRYFSSADDLLLAATEEGSLLIALEAIADAIGDSPDPRVRLDRLVAAFQELVRDHEQSLRAVLRLAIADPTASEAVRMRSVYRFRRRWIDQVLEPLAGKIDATSLERLALALSLCMGTEAHIVLQDIHEVPAEETVHISRWAAEAVLAEALREAGLANEDWK